MMIPTNVFGREFRVSMLPSGTPLAERADGSLVLRLGVRGEDGDVVRALLAKLRDNPGGFMWLLVGRDELPDDVPIPVVTEYGA